MVQAAIRHTQVAAATSGGTQDITVPGLTETPVGVVLKITSATATDGTAADHALLSAGVADGTTERCIAISAQDNVGTTRTRRVALTTACLAVMSPSADTVIGAWSLNTFIPGGVRLNRIVGSVGWIITAYFWVGDAVDFQVGSAFPNANGGAAKKITTGFAPQHVLAFSHGFPIDNMFWATARFMEGHAVDGSGGIKQRCTAWDSKDGAALSTTKHVLDPSICTDFDSDGEPASLNARTIVTDFLSDGFEIASMGAASTGPPFIYAAVRYGNNKVALDDFLTPTSTGVQSYNLGIGPGQAAFFLLSAHNNGATDWISEENQAPSGTGPYGASGEDGTHTINALDNDAADPTDTKTRITAGSLIVRNKDDSLTIYEANFDGFDADGFDLDWTTVAAVGRNFAVFMLGVDVLTIEPGGIPSAEAFGTPTVVAGVVIVEPGGIPSAEAFGTPAIQATALLAPGAIGSEEAFGEPAVVAGAVAIEPGSVPSAEAFGEPTVVAGLAMVDLDGIPSAEAFGTPTLVAGAVTIQPGGIPSGEAFGEPTLAAGVATVQPDSIPSAEAFGEPTVVAGAAPIQVPGIASGEALGEPTVLAAQTVEPGGIPSAEALGEPTLVEGLVMINPTGIPSEEALGEPTLAPGVVTIEPGGIPSEEALGEPTLVQIVVVRPTGIVSAEAIGLPTLTPGEAFIVPGGIPSTEALGLPSLVGGDNVILLSGIASEEALGTPFLSGGLIPVTLKKKIHDALINAAKGGTFVIAEYDGDTCTLEQGTQVIPESILANEIESAYTREGRHGRKLRDDRTAWRWELRLRFHQEVITELFEEALLADPIIVPRETDDPSSRQAIVSLLNARFEHPPQQGASNGTEVVFEVNAQVSPV